MNTQRFQQVLPVLLLVFSLAVLPGCWSSKELNELAVVMALGIDTAPQGYAVSAQVLNSGEARNNKGESGKSLPVLTYKATGQTVPDALQHILSAAPHALYLSHIRVLVLGEELARQGVSDIMDFITRNHQLRSDFFLVVAKHSLASDILEINTSFEPIPANSLYSSILVSHKKTGRLPAASPCSNSFLSWSAAAPILLCPVFSLKEIHQGEARSKISNPLYQSHRLSRREWPSSRKTAWSAGWGRAQARPSIIR
ncbi:hypothetical protein ACFSQ7_11080 [Paenibacillus rhizoplanae]